MTCIDIVIISWKVIRTIHGEPRTLHLRLVASAEQRRREGAEASKIKANFGCITGRIGKGEPENQ